MLLTALKLKIILFFVYISLPKCPRDIIFQKKNTRTNMLLTAPKLKIMLFYICILPPKYPSDKFFRKKYENKNAFHCSRVQEQFILYLQRYLTKLLKLKVFLLFCPSIIFKFAFTFPVYIRFMHRDKFTQYLK